ncbi:uncharacterized protein ACOB8E_001544 isoform 2-T3 [Sarcophilus harrisii]
MTYNEQGQVNAEKLLEGLPGFFQGYELHNQAEDSLKLQEEVKAACSQGADFLIFCLCVLLRVIGQLFLISRLLLPPHDGSWSLLLPFSPSRRFLLAVIQGGTLAQDMKLSEKLTPTPNLMQYSRQD